MKKINVKNIDFDTLKLTEFQGSNSYVFVKDNTCYKFFKGMDLVEKNALLEKIKRIKKIKIDNVIMPKDLIMKDGEFIGYTMDYFSDSICLQDFFTMTRYIDINDIFSLTKKISKILRKIHSCGVVISDFSFYNVLIDMNESVRISDIDGCMFGNFSSSFISKSLYDLYDGDFEKASVESDKLSLLLSMILSIYNKDLTRLDIDSYDKLAKNVVNLQNMRKMIIDIKNHKMIDIPYLDQIIVEDDHYIIDRKEQIYKKKIFKRNK